MLFHTFASQDERRKFGGSAFMELQKCRQKPGTKLEKILSIETIAHWKNDSLYVYIDDMEGFYALYGKIFRDGCCQNGERGMVDCYGVNYYTPEQTARIARALAEEKPADFQVLLDWLKTAENDNGIYLLGL